MITRRSCHENKSENYRGHFLHAVLTVATYNEDGSANVMNAAWGTMQERDSVALNLTETHKTVQNIKARGAFTVSIADAAHIFCRFFSIIITRLSNKEKE